jgi:hypothetical protein
MAFGLDYSAGRPSHAAMKTAGVEFVCRYIGSKVHDSNRDAKWLSPAEAKALHDDGFDIVVVFETTATRAEAGSAAGISDAAVAQADLVYCGLPADLPIYFAVDEDTTVGPHITAYFEGLAHVLGVKRVGAYGGYEVIKALLDAKLITWAWQTYAWSSGRWDTRNHIEQYSNNRSVGGAGVDYDRSMKPDFGQWPATVKPATKPPKWPGRYLKVASPLMHGSDVKWVQERLNSHGTSPKLTTDSEYGTKTAAAVRAFQKKQHLTVDAIVGEDTWNALAK